MTDNPKNTTKLNDDLAMTVRRAVNNAYAFVQGQETALSFSCITFEDLAAMQIERIDGKQTRTRSNAINRIRKVKESLVSVTSTIKSLPADAFRKPDENKDVNTKP